jgi:diguanylate cyclase (GGDEF)-like protein
MAQVRLSHAQLHDLSIRDGLTGLFNRRHFDAALEQAAFDASHGSIPFAVLLIDLDRFKPINDQYGHAAGDAVLVSVADSIRAAIRETDLAARIGGDEFAVLALATTADIAHDLADRIRIAVSQPELRFGHASVYASCSVGVGCFPDDGRLAPDLMHSADVAMYADKTRRGESR